MQLSNKIVSPQIDTDDLKYRISDIIDSSLFLSDVPYSLSPDGEKQIDPESIDLASEAIVKMLGQIGLLSGEIS